MLIGKELIGSSRAKDKKMGAVKTAPSSELRRVELKEVY